jgi:hypothetical protein
MSEATSVGEVLTKSPNGACHRALALRALDHLCHAYTKASPVLSKSYACLRIFALSGAGFAPISGRRT